MFGAILGDIIGSPYEFDRGGKTKDFLLFSENSCFTDDTVMTVAVAEAFLDARDKNDTGELRSLLIKSLKKWGKMYPDAGYGARFGMWLFLDGAEPYNSFGNGSAMRVSSVAWLYDDLETVRKMARLSAEITHNHPEGIKGAEATASAIFMARTGHTKEEIKEYIETRFGYDLHRTCDEIRPYYRHTESCQETVPEAIIAFLESDSFEDTIRTAVSLGGDCDTLTAIAASIAEGYYGVADHFRQDCYDRVSPEISAVLMRMEEIIDAA